MICSEGVEIQFPGDGAKVCPRCLYPFSSTEASHRVVSGIDLPSAAEMEAWAMEMMPNPQAQEEPVPAP